ncbi:unnamed protein product [Lactuca virosa]|uniref:Uncharacterized protein n=1 Tax=Lactuca virosa TaxID=75947 RepID=A0AAU9P7Q8_9ASTR|nr:unnamed protein product [Lactuca virosa]
MTRVEIISRENIKPSSPTPLHLKSYNLSILDQLIPAPYAPIILYYPNQDQASDLEVQERLKSLKISLSKTLTRFYPLAGTIKDDLSIDCTDVGAYFAVAHVDAYLDEFLNHPDFDLINRFLPCEPSFNGSNEGSHVSNIQVNIFECGGIAISLCISHKILDGAALNTFLRGWAGTCCGSKEVVYPNMNTSSLFPAKDLWLKDSSMVMWGSLFKMGKCSTKRFVFSSSKLDALKAEAVGNRVKHATRVEVVSALLWKCMIAASEEKAGFWKPSLLSHVVNLRKRILSSLSLENSIGNLIWIADAECKTESEIGLGNLVGKVRDGVSRIDGEFVKNMQGDKGIEVMEDSLKRLKDCGDYVGFTSWCKMGFYQVDFGWGKPMWVCGSVSDGSPVFMNFIVLMDTRCGEGIEAWVSMDEQEMHILKQNSELLEFASLDPSPLDMNNDLEVQEKLKSLKNSLSNTLTRFYPLAGTIKDDLSIDCTDIGAYFAVARVDASLEEFLKHPDFDLINRFLPCEPSFNGSNEGSHVSNIQVNIFECGGIAIGLCISHKILDGAALSTFLRGWAGTCCGLKEVVQPNMNTSSLFPAKDLWLKDSSMVMWKSLFKMGKCSTKRFVFSSSKLDALKEKTMANGVRVKDPTRVEVVSGLLWKCVMAASEEKTGSWKPSLLSHVVNLRKRVLSSFPLENSIGNLIWIADAECKTESEIELGNLVGKVHDGVSRIDSEFVKELQGDKGREMMEDCLKRLKDCGDHVGFTSWCKMGFYEVDFGWGKPMWVCGSVSDGSPVFMNLIILIDTRCGEGIEAWVSMDEHEINILKHNFELLEFASLDPSPLEMNN